MNRNVVSRARRGARAALIAALFVAAAVAPPVVWGVMNVFLHVRAQMPPPAQREMPDDLAPLAPHIRSRKTAVVITGNGGAEMSDFLIPYETLATTGAFNMYVVAPERRVIPLANAGFRDGGLDLVPHYSIDGYDQAIGTRPDVIVIPFLPTFMTGEERSLIPWIRKHADAGALVVSICAGSEVLAATGIIDGARATTHPNFFARLEATYPEVTWLRDVRYVETERTISSGAIASGMDATLAAIRRLLGRGEAERVARELGYPHTRFLDDPAHPSEVAWTSFLGAAVSPGRSRLGVLLYDGVSEVAVGSLFDTYPTTLSTSLVALAEHEGVIRTRNGMLLVPRGPLTGAADLDGLLVPGVEVPAEIAAAAARWTRDHGGGTSFVHVAQPGFAYDGAIADIARRDGRLAAEAVAVNLNYPIDHVTLRGVAVPAHVVVIPLLWSAVGVLGLIGLRRWWRGRRARRRARLPDPQVVGVQHRRAGLERERALEHVAQLADVARPRVRSQRHQRPG